ncbi:hypothetical protein [Roseobacter sp. GAI101]|uniref:hypothetical protein n=1 Tax=Roseobacter sp. (strain GAI101) TaxID=391589 RepID=UPI0003140301|nr:hypothetical protein [Roseobacter sp. GAI101]
MSAGFKLPPGGGFNAMVAAKRAGMSVSYGGSIRTGPFANVALEGLAAEQIDVLRPHDTTRRGIRYAAPF